MAIRFSRSYFISALMLLLVEIFIAMYITDAIIRPYVGDFLVVILLYCMIKSLLDADATAIAAGVLIFSYVLEFLQYFRIVEILGLGDYRLANIIIGTSFAWMDIVAYTLGISAVLIAERKIFK